MDTINITAYIDNTTQIDAIKAFLKALKIKYKVSNDTDLPYNSSFVDMINKGKQEIAEGKGIKLSIEEFKDLCK